MHTPAAKLLSALGLLLSMATADVLLRAAG